VAGTEILAGDRSAAAEVRIVHRQVHVRKARTGAQRGKPATVIVVQPNRAEPAAVTAIPGMEMVAWSEWQPADRTTETEAKSKAEPKSRPEAKE
jgi:hypothetical protein